MKLTTFSLLIILLFIGQVLAEDKAELRYNTAGVDMEILSYGGSLGGFWAYHAKPGIAVDAEADWSLVESKDTFSYLNYYGQPVSVNSRNLSFVKLLLGVNWFPFLETMHSSVQVGGFASAGPLLSLNTADDEGFLDRWQEVETDLTPMVRAGVNLRILTGNGSFYIFKIGYDYARFDHVIDSRQTYQGLFFQAGMEFLNK
ncbi:MAG: hypothetical protein K9M49_03105 [Candidatus Marinimicrobia bacterium]|nr:hypothetical protein [Candidatus Neomarinimicrobiota bacterium]MCF7850548.1 hypothetical protein [Candidatus Neomarinimicrobiota bacterium]MCF7904122.1 hypothetical protein [Candidatus Neomarinimicrobiota bacterium]